MKIINIYPCVDALLYAPIYLAIESYRYRGGIQSRGKPQVHPDYTEWTFDDQNLPAIRLHKPTGNDFRNYERLKEFSIAEKEKDVIHIAVGDPFEALLHPAEAENKTFHVLATFVNRIALWCVCSSAIRDPHRRRVAQLLRSAAQEGNVPLFVKTGTYKDLRLGYSSDGATTRALMEYFASPLFRVLGGVAPGLGLPELENLRDGAVDITFSFEPWLIYTLTELTTKDGKQKPKGFEILPWFHSVPYPFSSLTIFAEEKSLSQGQQDLLTQFLQHCQIGLAMVFRFRPAARDILLGLDKELRGFGRASKVAYDIRQRMFEVAFGQLFLADCFCETLGNSWQAWDLAIEVNASREGTRRKSKEDIHRATEFGRRKRREPQVADWTFRSPDFREALGAIVNNRSEGYEVRPLPPGF